MIRTISGINVYSDDYLDFCIIPENSFEKAEDIIRDAYDNWFTSSDIVDSDITMADYISQCLNEQGIEHEIYFIEQSEER